MPSPRPVIGLPPTAAGKRSATSPSLVQPGFTFIVDLRSLMIDQKSSLEAMIHRCHTFMRVVRCRHKRRRFPSAWIPEDGWVSSLVSTSLERLQIPEFINLVNRQMDNITYCVVDEAHCVSEWGTTSGLPT